MFIYVIRDKKSCNSPIKIGKARYPEKRLKILQTGYPEKLYIVHLVKCKSDCNALDIEWMIHKKLRRYKINGEWFTCEALGQFKAIMNAMDVMSRRHINPALKGCWTI